MTFNLTPKRVEALRYIAKHPGVLVGDVAQQVLAVLRADGTPRLMSRQGATLAGAGYCKPLAAAGLITLNTHVRVGYGVVTITPAGMAVLAEHAGSSPREYAP